MLDFTYREMKRAWREHHDVYKEASIPTNPHRLLLFYAVECGLKAVIMERERLNITNEIIYQLGHNINELLKYLRADPKLHLKSVQMKTISFGQEQQQRAVDSSQFNQMWRYGGQAKGGLISDEDIEQQLVKIINWIEEELLL